MPSDPSSPFSLAPRSEIFETKIKSALMVSREIDPRPKADFFQSGNFCFLVQDPVNDNYQVHLKGRILSISQVNEELYKDFTSTLKPKTRAIMENSMNFYKFYKPLGVCIHPRHLTHTAEFLVYGQIPTVNYWILEEAGSALFPKDPNVKLTPGMKVGFGLFVIHQHLNPSAPDVDSYKAIINRIRNGTALAAVVGGPVADQLFQLLPVVYGEDYYKDAFSLLNFSCGMVFKEIYFQNADFKVSHFKISDDPTPAPGGAVAIAAVVSKFNEIIENEGKEPHFLNVICKGLRIAN